MGGRDEVVMKRNYLPLLIVAVFGCDYDPPCFEDYADTPCPEATEPCYGETGSETGTAECTVLVEPEIDETWMSCADVESEIEVMTESAVHAYGVTDWAFETSTATLAGLIDFLPLTALDAGLVQAVPGVVTHGEGAYVGLFSRVCCAQRVMSGVLPTFPENPTCASAGHALPAHPGAWCLDMLDGSHAGLCVYPCADDWDCPVTSEQACDLQTPDPSGRGPGTCRFRSMPDTPTPEDQIGN